MRTKFVLLLLCCALSTDVFAHGIGAVPVVKDARWTVIQIGVWPFLLFDDGAKVMGLNLNLILTCQRREVWGITLAPFNSCEDDVGGLTIGLTQAEDELRRKKEFQKLEKSFSKSGNFRTVLSIRWGASPAGNYKYVKQIPNPVFQKINQSFRTLKIPGNNWRVNDPGHIHIIR